MVGNLLPFYALKKVYDTEEFKTTGVKGLSEYNALTSDFHDISSETIEDYIAKVFHRQAHDTTKTRDFLFLFRLLEVKYRIAYPMVGDKPLQIDENLLLFLEKWICQSFIEFFEYFQREVMEDKKFSWVI